MLLKNVSTSRGLVNGARGVVVGFEESARRSEHYAMLPIVKFECVLGSQKVVEEICVVEDTWEINSGNRSTIELFLLFLKIHGSININNNCKYFMNFR